MAEGNSLAKAATLGCYRAPLTTAGTQPVQTHSLAKGSALVPQTPFPLPHRTKHLHHGEPAVSAATSAHVGTCVQSWGNTMEEPEPEKKPLPLAVSF